MKKIVLIVGVPVFLIFMFLAVDFVYGDYKSYQNRIVKSLDSPDQSLRLTAQINHDKSDPTRYLCVIVNISENKPDGKTLYREITPASSRMNWSIRWESNDRIALESSDIGPASISRQEDGTWEFRSAPFVKVDFSDKTNAIEVVKVFITRNNIEVIDIENPVEVTDQGDVWHIIFNAPQSPDALPPFRGFNIHKDTGAVYETPRY